MTALATWPSELPAWLALVNSIVSAMFTWIGIRDRRTSEKRAHIARVSVEVVERRSNVTDYQWSSAGADIIVRNDVPSAITIGTVGLAYGGKFVLDERHPVHWDIDAVPPGRLARRLLPPGEELRVEAPPGRTDVSQVGAVVSIVDTNGRQWQRTEWDWRPLGDVGGKRWSRRHLWFERQPWFTRLDSFLYRRAAKKVGPHPRRLPWEVRLIDCAWGYRIGYVDLERPPWNAPRTWRYQELLPQGDTDRHASS